jgi:ESCRT-I complex subunit TSG101
LLSWRRLINLVAEDNAIEDTIYHLHRALNAGKLDLDKFLKVQHPDHLIHAPFSLTIATSQTTRQLAEEQFMKRALIEKIISQLPMGLRM